MDSRAKELVAAVGPGSMAVHRVSTFTAFSTLDAAQEYVSFGWSVIPIKPQSKTPAIGSWKEFQSRLATEAELKEWFGGNSKNNVAIVTGKLSGLAVIDDDGEGLNGTETLTARSSKGKRHLYLKYSEGIRNSAHVNGRKYDVRGEGGYIVAPPSTHPSGAAYTWQTPPSPAELSDFPTELLKSSKGKSVSATPALEGEGEIQEGRRNSFLTSLAGRLRRRASTEAEILAELGRENEARCNPRLSDGELQTIARSVSRYEPFTFKRTELGNAQRFLDKHSERFLYHGEMGKWFYYDGRRWVLDHKLRAEARAQQVIHGLLQEAEAEVKERQEATKWAARSQRTTMVKAMLDAARSHESVVVDRNDLDTEKVNLLLNLRNGTLDLQTLELKEHDSSDRITMISQVSYDAGAEAPRWIKFLLEVFDDDKELISFLQRLFGYAVQGGQQEHILPVFWGDGSNGKSTFLETVAKVFGDYKVELPIKVVMRRKLEDGYSGDILLMKGRRLVTCNETDEGGLLQENVVKALTGGDAVVGRGHYKASEEFMPTHTLIIRSNHKPRIVGVDEGIWRRVLLVPFTQCFVGANKDIDLGAKLLTELPGILNWILNGVTLYAEKGLDPPKVVREATEVWRVESDEVGIFFDMATYEEGKEPAGAKPVGLRELYKAYQEWKGPRAQIPEKTFNERLRTTRKLVSRKKAGGHVWPGVYLRQSFGEVGHYVH